MNTIIIRKNNTPWGYETETEQGVRPSTPTEIGEHLEAKTDHLLADEK